VLAPLPSPPDEDEDAAEEEEEEEEVEEEEEALVTPPVDCSHCAICDLSEWLGVSEVLLIGRPVIGDVLRCPPPGPLENQVRIAARSYE